MEHLGLQCRLPDYEVTLHFRTFWCPCDHSFHMYWMSALTGKFCVHFYMQSNLIWTVPKHRHKNCNSPREHSKGVPTYRCLQKLFGGVRVWGGKGGKGMVREDSRGWGGGSGGGRGKEMGNGDFLDCHLESACLLPCYPFVHVIHYLIFQGVTNFLSIIL